MKKSDLLIILLGSTLFLSVQSAFGESLYYGAGGSYAWQRFNTDDLNRQWSPFGFDVKFSDAPGTFIKMGYDFDEKLAAEVEVGYLYDFNYDQKRFVWGAPWDPSAVSPGPFYKVPIRNKGDADVATLTAAGKYGIPVTEDAKPYIIAGGGLMYWHLEVSDTTSGYYLSNSETNLGGCAKVGAGIEFKAWQDYSIIAEGSYVAGFGDVDKVRFIVLEIGLIYRPPASSAATLPIKKIEPEAKRY
ncbi:MAG: outer membrane beta-barrel protein [Syntrophales bacterium]|jgi:opacity protein-like surface antigen